MPLGVRTLLERTERSAPIVLEGLDEKFAILQELQKKLHEYNNRLNAIAQLFEQANDEQEYAPAAQEYRANVRKDSNPLDTDTVTTKIRNIEVNVITLIGKVNTLQKSMTGMHTDLNSLRD